MPQLHPGSLFLVPPVEEEINSKIRGTQKRKCSNYNTCTCMCTCTRSYTVKKKKNVMERFSKTDHSIERQFTENMSRRCQSRIFDDEYAHHSACSKSGVSVYREDKDKLVFPPRNPFVTSLDIRWVLTWWRTLTMLIVLSLLVSGVRCDLCVNKNKGPLRKAIVRSAIPRGGKNAGHYGRLKNADTLSKCILGCCHEARCNAVFYHNATCYTISCEPQDPHACDALPMEEAKYKDTYFVKLRSTDETPHSRPEPTENMSPKDFKLVRECEPDDDRCPINEKCTMYFDEEVFGYRCKCTKGFERNEDTTLCQAIDSTCEYGLKQCGEHEECTLQEGSKSRQGRCECESGYQRDPATGHCLHSEVIVEPDTVRAVGTSKPEKKSSAATTTTEPSKVTTKRSTPPSSTKPPVINLIVSAGKNKEIQLPVDDVSLVAFALPKAASGEEYQYEWSLLSGPDTAEKGSMADKNTDTLKLSDLIEGLYTFKIVVTGPNKYGEGFINVTVKPPVRTNQPPVSIIKPKSQSVVLPKLPILDGSDSTDDDKVVSYKWEEVSGPIQGHQIDGKDALLRLTDLVPGNYSFKLTVTDSDGATNSSIANVTVIKETDYPPKSLPGPDIIIRLPQKEAMLYGNGSTDDKEIVSYEWTNTGDKELTANMLGVHKPILHLSGLQEGDYVFSLVVTDSAGQTDKKDAHVFVKKAVNAAPVANAGREQTVALPLQSLTLNGTNSTDDKGIVMYKWEQISGPNTGMLTLSNGDKAVTMANGDVQKGDYSFQLTVTDAEKEENSATVKIHVVENPNKPPKADAGGDQTVVLPQAFIVLNGSKSSDDYGIVAYLWSRDASSLAAGDVLNGSDHLAVMEVANVIPGRYVFNLKVTDAEGLTSSDTATVTVKPDSHRLNMLELHIKADISTFTEGNKRDLEDQLGLLLHKSNAAGDTKVKITQLLEEQSTGHMIVRFYVLNVMKEQSVLRDGMEAAQTMREIIAEKASILDYTLITVDTAVCQNNCSGHGVCNQYSKRCVCEAFWMENFFKAYVGPKLSNCDWSILYVVIVLFLIVVSSAGSVWLLLCCCKKKRCRCWKTKRRHRYTLLHETDDKEEIGMIPKASKLQSSSLMMSDSDFTSEEETLFISQKKTNGHIPKRPNGISKPYGKNKARA